MKKFFIITVIAAVICLTFAGCGTNSAEQAPPPNNGNNQTETIPEQKENSEMYITINGNKVKVTLAENSSVDALVEILKQGDIVYTAKDYGGFEKVGHIGHSLPSSDTEITTQAGDVMLYCGNQIVIFYGSNSYLYTRLGKINGYSVSELRSFLGAGEGDVQITLSLS